jgi:hypothetical protein
LILWRLRSGSIAFATARSGYSVAKLVRLKPDVASRERIACPERLPTLARDVIAASVPPCNWSFGVRDGGYLLSSSCRQKVRSTFESSGCDAGALIFEGVGGTTKKLFDRSRRLGYLPVRKRIKPGSGSGIID